MAGDTSKNKKYSSNALIELDCDIVSEIFNTIKQKGVLGQAIKYNLDDKLKETERLLNSNDFIDLIKLHRLKKHISMRDIAQHIGKDEETYRQYELKHNEIQDYKIAEKLIKVLELQNILELPDYFKIMKRYSKENIIEIINKVGKKTFSEETNIPISTIDYWNQKKSGKTLSSGSYKKMVDFFINHKIIY